MLSTSISMVSAAVMVVIGGDVKLIRSAYPYNRKLLGHAECQHGALTLPWYAVPAYDRRTTSRRSPSLQVGA